MTGPEYPRDIVDRVRVVEVEEDVCDACGAPGFVYAKMRFGSTLVYCAHHGTEYWARLHEQAITVIDHRWRLTDPDLPDES